MLGRGVERFRFAPWGVFGGKCAERARIVRNLGRPDEEELGKIDVVDTKLGDTITVLTPGGGGYGNPLERDAELVLADVRRGVVSEAGAKANYGVIIGAGELDLGATQSERSRRSAVSTSGGTFDFGEERLIWDEEVAGPTAEIWQHFTRVCHPQRATARYKIHAPLMAVLRRGCPLERQKLSFAAKQVLQAVAGERFTP